MRLFYILAVLSAIILIAESKPVNNENDQYDDDDDDPHKHPYGHSISLMKFEEDEIVIDNAALDKIFQHPEVKNRKIVAVSIIGAFRKGKSFLMDYALRYMYANYKSVAYPNNPLDHKSNWIGDTEAPLKGFSWRGGSDRDTTGVVLWSDVFLHDDLAIVLMDTQGLFDTVTSPTENSRIFALGTLISSLQIFNLNDVIQENQLEYLQLATEFAKLAQKSGKKGRKNMAGKPFQTLLFLMRDWHNQQDHDFGSDGGAQYLAKTLTIKPEQPKELQEVRKFIAESYDSRLCYLLPHPGLKVVGNKAYAGQFSWLERNFQDHLKELLHWILAPNKLKVKKMLDAEVTGGEYLEYLKMYFDIFKSDEIPEVQTIHTITINKQFDIIVETAFNEYKKLLEKVEFKIKSENGTEIWKEQKALEDELDQSFLKASEAAEKLFKDKKKMGSKADEKTHFDKLKDQMKKHFDAWKNDEMITYVKLKTLEEDQIKELERLKKEKELELERQRKEAEEARIKLEELHKKKTEDMNKMINDLNAESVAEVTNLKKTLEEQAKETQRKFEDEKKRIEAEAREKQENFQKQLLDLNKEMQKKSQQANMNQNSNKDSELVKMFMMQAKEREQQIQMQMTLETKKEERREEQRKLEQQMHQDMLREMRESMQRAEEKAREAEERRAEKDREARKLELQERLSREQLQMKQAQQQQEMQREQMRMLAEMFAGFGQMMMSRDQDAAIRKRERDEEIRRKKEEQERKLEQQRKLKEAEEKYKREQQERERMLEKQREDRRLEQERHDREIQRQEDIARQESERKEREHQEAADAQRSDSQKQQLLSIMSAS